MEKKSNHNSEYNFPQSLVEKLFPFSFTIDKTLELSQLGPSLKKIIPNKLKNKHNFLDIFNITAPIGIEKIDFENLKNITGNLVLIAILDKDNLVLKGQLEYLSDIDKITFFGTLSVDQYKNIIELGLTNNDIPTYDRISDKLLSSTDLKKKPDQTSDTNKYFQDLEKINILASFPNENPNPILRIDRSGNIIFCNKKALELSHIKYQNVDYTLQDFWKYITNSKFLITNNIIDVTSNNKSYSFNLVEGLANDEKNIYGNDITAIINSERRAYENLSILNNFIESTNDVFYLTYKENNKKNFFTSQWSSFFGFDPNTSNIEVEKRNSIEDKYLNNYDNAISNLKLNGEMHVKYKLRNKLSGESKWVLEMATLRHDKTINDYFISGRITDITSNEYFKNQINESEERFQLITESMPVMIWVSNENNIVTYTNQASRDFYGFDLKNLKNKDDFSYYVHPDYRTIAIEEWAIKINAKIKCEVQYLVKNKLGEYRWIYEIAIPRFINNNEFLGYIGCGFDITSERNMFFTLEEEKIKYELLSNHSADIIFLIDINGNIEFVSPSIKRILGFEASNKKGKSLFEFIEKNSNISINSFINNKNQVNNPVLSFQIKDAYNELKWVEASYNVFNEDKLGGKKIIIHLRDINEQYQAQSMVIENEAKYRNLFSNMSLGIMEVDNSEKIMYVNPSFERISGYTESELLGKMAPEIFLEELNEKEINLQEKRNREHGKEGLYEIKIKKKNGKFATWIISGVPTFDMKGKIRGSIGIHWDVTDVRDLETKMLFESVQKEKQLMEARLYAEEKQRDTIGRDLHDGVGQMLAYLSIYMNILKEKPIVTHTDIDKAQITIKQTIDEVRRLSRNLAPPAIKDLGFRDAVIELIGSYSIIPKPAFSLKIYKSKDPDIFLYEQKIMLFRVLQELSSNTFKYAKANKVVIKIAFNKNEIRLDYSDDGVGFELETVKKGIGLKSILSRVEFYGGNVIIKSKPNHGTEVIINLPFELIT